MIRSTPTDPQPALLRCAMALPADFRVRDIFEFHRRDPLAFAEQVDESAAILRKGLAWQGFPACLTLRFQAHQVAAELAVDGLTGVLDVTLMERRVRHMLGLTQPVDEFEQAYCEHPQLGWLIRRHQGLRVPLSATPFEALTWAVTSQQISVGAAVSLRRKLIQAAGLRHSGGLACYPEAAQVAVLDIATLRRSGFSQTKAGTLLELSRMVLEGTLPLDAWMLHMPPVEEVRDRLLGVRGVGPWTVNYALLRGFGWLDGSLHGDAGVRRGIQRLLASSEKVGEAQARAWLAQFTPWRALVAAHLWAWEQP